MVAGNLFKSRSGILRLNMHNPNVFLFLVVSIFVGKVLSTTTSPKYVVTKAAYGETVSSLNAHVRFVKSLPDRRIGSTPLFFIHPPGTRVHGSVIFFHGFPSLAAGSRVRAKFLFAQKFNVVALNLAGLAQSPKHWVSTVFRDTAGYSAIRAALLKDPVVGSRIKAFKDAKTSEAQLKFVRTLKELTMPLVLKALRKNLNSQQFETAKQAIALLDADEEIRGTEKQFSKYFRSGHQRYESDPFAKLRFVQALPGPIHAVSFSFGATALMNLAAQSRVISKGVMLAPYLAWHTDKFRVDITHFFSGAWGIGFDLSRRFWSWGTYSREGTGRCEFGCRTGPPKAYHKGGQ